MASEFTPVGQGAKMTKAQVRRYIREMKIKREEAKKKLEAFENSGEFQKEQEEVEKLEQQIAALHEENNSSDSTDTTNWKVLTKKEFLNKEKLYKKFLGFSLSSPNLKDIFNIPVKKNLYETVKKYGEKEKKILQNIYKSEQYTNYLYADTSEKEIIIQTN